MRGHGDAGRKRIARHGPAVDEVLSIGRPEGAGLHKLRIVGAGQRPHLLFDLVVPGQDAARGIKDLDKVDVAVIDAEEAIDDSGREPGRFFLMGVLQLRRTDGCDYIPAVWRNLRHETEPLHFGRVTHCIGIFLERAPADHILVVDGYVLRDRNDSVEALVVARSIHVDAHGLAVSRKRVAIGAGRQILHHSSALGLANVAYLPLDERKRRWRQWRDGALLVDGRKHQRNIAVKDGRADLVP